MTSKFTGGQQPTGGRRWVPKPCRKCGGPKPKGHGRWYCEDCEEIIAWETGRRAQLRRAATRKPCADCLGPKEPGKRRLCDKCRAKRQGPRLCERCGVSAVPRDTRRKLCDSCLEQAAEKRRELDRQRRRRDRQDAAKKQAMREACQRWYDRMLADPARRERWLESKRMQHRARMAAKGRPIRRASTVTPINRRGEILPGHQLAAVIDRIAQRRSANGNPFARVSDENDDSLVTLCESIEITTRGVYGWRVGERDVFLEHAEEVLQRLGAFWWEVWTEDTVRKHTLTVTTYRQARKRLKSGKGWTQVRVRKARRFYGDEGPDLVKLAEIARAFTGARDVEQVAA